MHVMATATTRTEETPLSAASAAAAKGAAATGCTQHERHGSCGHSNAWCGLDLSLGITATQATQATPGTTLQLARHTRQAQNDREAAVAAGCGGLVMISGRFCRPTLLGSPALPPMISTGLLACTPAARRVSLRDRLRCPAHPRNRASYNAYTPRSVFSARNTQHVGSGCRTTGCVRHMVCLQTAVQAAARLQADGVRWSIRSRGPIHVESSRSETDTAD